MRIRVKDDRGATAIIIALCAVVLLGMVAFTVDLGLAYANKRALQKGADAAALAAASEIVKESSPTENCAQITARWTSNTGGFRDQVTAVADTYATDNEFLDTNRADMRVRCSADNKRVEVYYAGQGTTPSPFGKFFGVGSISTQREATADLFVRDEGTGLRPYFICDGDLIATLLATKTSGTYAAVKYPSASAGCNFYNGNWYTSDCPRDGNNGTLDTNTEFGCKDSVGVVIDQETAPPPGQAQIDAAIIASCSDATVANPTLNPQSCLVANPGNVAANNVVQAWDYLLTLPGIALPIFDQTWNTYADTNVAKCKGGGNGGCYPVKALSAVKVCAYKWGNNKTGKSSDATNCPGIGAEIFPNDNDNYLYLRLMNVQYSGSSSPGGCPVGGNCDLGGRGTRLIL